MKNWSSVWQNLFLGVLGGGMYYIMEVFFRGHSHWSMFLLGGGCFCWIDYVFERMNFVRNVFGKMAISAMGITFLELITGCVVNLWLKLDVWNYSKLPLQVMGQISFIFSFFWFLLSFPAMKISKSIRILFFQ